MLDDRSQSLSKAILHGMHGGIPIAMGYFAVALSSASLPFKPTLQPLVALDTEDGQTSILTSLCHAEEDSPQHPFGSSTDRQQHLSKRQDIKRYAAQQDDDPRTE